MKPTSYVHPILPQHDGGCRGTEEQRRHTCVLPWEVGAQAGRRQRLQQTAYCSAGSRRHSRQQQLALLAQQPLLRRRHDFGGSCRSRCCVVFQTL